MAAWKRKKETREELVALLSFRGNLTVFFLRQFLSWTFVSTYPSLQALSDITARKKDLRMRSSACQSELRAKWGRADGHCFKPLTRMTLSPPQLCPTAHRTSIFLIGCFRCWTKQTQVHARTSARCINGDYLSIPPCTASSKYSHCFPCISLSLFFFSPCNLSHLSPSPSLFLWTAPLLVQLSLYNACKEKWPRLKVTGGTGVPFKW